jgi:uncharacterized RDD family membrane protein YckC
MKTDFLSPLLFVLLIVLVLLTVFGIFYLYVTSKSKERMALIEKGMNPNLAKSDFWIQIGIIATGAPLGLILGNSYGPLVGFMLAGIGLVVYNIYRKRS